MKIQVAGVLPRLQQFRFEEAGHELEAVPTEYASALPIFRIGGRSTCDWYIALMWANQEEERQKQKTVP